MEDVDYLILGQGIAGSVLAWELMQRGFSIKVIDDHHKTSASRIAAGILNPITGKRLVMSSEFQKFLSTAISFYKNLEATLSKKFYYERDVLRVLKNKNELTKYQNRKTEDDYLPFLGDFFKAHSLDFAQDSFGSFVIKHAGNLDTKAFINSLRAYFQSKNALFEDLFDYSALAIEGDSVTYKTLTAKKIIFCEGYRVIENPFFKHLKWELAKGEILTIKFKEPLPDYIVNKGKWILPSPEGFHRVGATYDWDHFDNSTTAEGRTEIIETLSGILKHPECEVVDQQAGVRPTTKDTHPFIGLHENHPAIALFNGFGSKGTLLAPYYAKRLADFLKKGTPLDPSVSLSRKL